MRAPNILLITGDQHRADCVGYAQKYPVQTPHLDQLAAEGMWFSHAFTTIPTCCPARQSLLTGRTAESIGALWNYDITLPVSALSPEDDTWTKRLKESGYHLAYIGKWHVNPNHDPSEYGFDYYYGVEEYEHYFQTLQAEKTFVNGWKGEMDVVELEDTRTHVFARKAIEKMRELHASGQPWHIRLDFPEPHLPCRPAQEFFEMYDPADIPKWHNFDDSFIAKPFIQRQQLKNWNVERYNWEDWAPIVARYYGIISQCDDAVGRMLQALKEIGAEENTLVIYTTDHGDMGGAHRMVDKHYIMYDDVVQVPLVMRLPGVIMPGIACHEFISHTLDLPPTILELSGLPLPDYFQGRSFLPFLQNHAIDNWRQDVVVTYHGAQFGLYCQRMIRTREWKYVWNPTDLDELYHLETDPGELNNIIDRQEYADILIELKKRLYRRLKELKDDILRQHWLVHQLTGEYVSSDIKATV